MELATRFDTSDQFEDEPTQDRGVYPAGSERLLELQRMLASDQELFAFVDMFARFNADTRSVFRFLGERHVVGERKYGAVDLLGDTRNFEEERAQECGDLLMYSAFMAVLETLKKRRAQ